MGDEAFLQQVGIGGIGLGGREQQGHLARVDLAPPRARRAEIPQVALEPLDAPQQPPPVDFELRLTRTARPDATTLLAQLRPATPEARQPVAQLCELDLYRAVLTRSVLGEDVE